MKSPHHILVIRLSAMGDVAIAVPVLTQLLETYPKLQITVLTKAFFAPLFQHLSRVQVVKAEVKTRHKGISGLWLLAKELHRLKIDAVADIHNVLRSRILCGFLKLMGHEYYRLNKGRSERKALTRPVNKVFKPLKPSYQRYIDVFEKLKLPLSKSIHVKRVQLSLDAEIDSTLNLDRTQQWVGIAPFAAHEPKQYPLSQMKKVISKLSQEKNLQIFLFGGGKVEEDKLNEISKHHQNCQTVVGKFTFNQELQLLSNLDLMLAMDSGNAHLAAMYGVKVVSIWGPTHPYTGFAPLGQTTEQQVLPDLEKYPLLPTSIYGNKQIKGYENVMADIIPEAVVLKVKSNLKK